MPLTVPYIFRFLSVMLPTFGVAFVQWSDYAIGDTSQVASDGQHTADVQAPTTSLLDKLQEEDSRFPTQYTVEFEIRSTGRSLGPDCGPWKRTCKFTVMTPVRVLIAETHYEGLPVYEHVGGGRTEPMDYDEDGNLIHWRHVRKWALSTPETNVLRDDQELFIISPDGVILEQARNTTHFIYPIESNDSFYEYNQFMLASGRGFTSTFTDIIEAESLDGDAMSLKARGMYAGDVPGEWDMLVKPSPHGALVRKAQFKPDQHANPAFKIITSGVMNLGDFSIAESRSIVYSPEVPRERRMDVSIKSFSIVPAQEHVRSVEAIFEAPTPQHVQVIDRRTRQ
jgi:hypothetical protein